MYNDLYMNKIKTPVLAAIISVIIIIFIIWITYPSNQGKTDITDLFGENTPIESNVAVIDYTGTLNEEFSYPKEIKKGKNTKIIDVEFVLYNSNFNDTEFKICQNSIDFIGEYPLTISGTFIEIDEKPTFVCRHQTLVQRDGDEVRDKYFYGLPYKNKTATIGFTVEYDVCATECDNVSPEDIDLLTKNIIETVKEK